MVPDPEDEAASPPGLEAGEEMRGAKAEVG